MDELFLSSSALDDKIFDPQSAQRHALAHLPNSLRGSARRHSLAFGQR
jgi:hypothetical protein